MSPKSYCVVITASSFENAPPSSLDPAASARVKVVTSKRDKRRKAAREAPTLNESVKQSQELISSSKQFENAPPSSLDPQAAQRISTGQKLSEIDRASEEAIASGGSVVQTSSQRVNLIGGAREETTPTTTPTIEGTLSRERVNEIIRGEIKRGVTPTTFTPQQSNLSFQTTRTDIKGDQPLIVSNVDTGSVGTSFIQADNRGQFEIFKENIGRKLFTKDTTKLTKAEKISLPFVAVKTAGEAAVDFGTSLFIKAPVKLAKALTVDIDKTLQGITDLITGETKLQDVFLSAEESFRRNPASFAGEVTFVVAGGKAFSKLGKGVKTEFVKFGSKEIPARDVFPEEVLSGQSKFPLVKSTKESLKLFDEADNIVQTSSPAKITGGEAGLGRKGAAGLEDTGIFVTPAGKGSPAFLRIADDGSEFSLIPSSPLENIRGAFDIPTVTRFKTTGTERLPREVVAEAGFGGVKKFSEKQSGSGKVFITKRSELGQGEIPKQKFKAPEDFVEGDFNIKKGDVRTEAGTSELEGFIPATSEFTPITPKNNFLDRLRGFNKYTEVKGEVVAIRDAELVTDVTRAASIAKGSPTQKIISGEQLQAEASFVSTPQKAGSSGSISRLEGSLSGVTTTSISEFKTSSPTPKGSVSSFSGTPSSSLSRSFVPPSSTSSIVSPSKSLITSSTISPTSSTISGGSSVSRGGSSKSSPSSFVSSPVGSSPTSSPRSPVSKVVGSSSSSPLSRVPNKPFFTPPYPLFKKEPSQQSFITQVIKKGKFVSVGRSSTIEGAFSKGSQVVGGSALRSFRVLEGGTPVNIAGLGGGRFRRSKSRATTAVEKSRYAINTQGEIFEISGASKRKRQGFI